MKIKCNKCLYIGEDSEFPKGQDLFQKPYIASCPKCDNRQNPGDASMRMFGGLRPFERVNESTPIKIRDKNSAILETLRRADSIS